MKSIELDLPPGPTGVTFVERNGLPSVNMVNDNLSKTTQLLNSSNQKYYISSVLIPGEIEISGMDIETLTDILKQYSNKGDRKLILTTAQQSASAPFTSKVTLPTGNIGVQFSKFGFPPVIKHISDTSPLTHKVKMGQVVQNILVPGQNICTKLRSSKLVDVLKKSSNVKERTLILAGKGKTSTLAKDKKCFGCAVLWSDMGALACCAVLLLPFQLVCDVLFDI